MSAKPAFERVELIDDGNLVGARWWQESMSLVDPIARRQALLGITGVLASVAVVGTCIHLAGSRNTDVEVTAAEALAAQKQHGWSVGSESEKLTFEGATNRNFDPSIVGDLVSLLAPKNEVHRPFFAPTLFAVVTATPTTTEVTVATPIRETLMPIETPAMQVALGRGKAFASLFDGAVRGKAIIVDLPGPESVAFASALAEDFDPVFVFDNWPHPKGVVPSHLTLAAALFHAPGLIEMAARRDAKAPPMFVLDENRLLPYSDESDRFDNRYAAKLPTAERLNELGITEILYVRNLASQTELDDLNADFVEYDKANIKIDYVAAEHFLPGAATVDDWEESDAGARIISRTRRPIYAPGETHYYYGSSQTHWFFWHHYGWGAPRRPAFAPLFSAPSYRPSSRSTIFGGPSAFRAGNPPHFGTVGIAHTSSGTYAGTRSPGSGGGSWGRSSGFSGG